MRHYNELSLKMLQLMVEREIIGIEKTHDVRACTIQFSNGDMVYEQGDGHKCETIYVEALVDDEMVDYEMEWDMEDEEITTVKKG